jgi:Na+:H+ antiporter, NhaA family
VFAVAILAGVGFTVAVLISDLAFAGTPDLQDHGKAAVLAGSVLAGLFATVLLRFRTAARSRRDDRDSTGPSG